MPHILLHVPNFESEKDFKVRQGDKKDLVNAIDRLKLKAEKLFREEKLEEAMECLTELSKLLEGEINKPHQYHIQANQAARLCIKMTRLKEAVDAVKDIDFSKRVPPTFVNGVKLTPQQLEARRKKKEDPNLAERQQFMNLDEEAILELEKQVKEQEEQLAQRLAAEQLAAQQLAAEQLAAAQKQAEEAAIPDVSDTIPRLISIDAAVQNGNNETVVSVEPEIDHDDDASVSKKPRASTPDPTVYVVQNTSNSARSRSTPPIPPDPSIEPVSSSSALENTASISTLPADNSSTLVDSQQKLADDDQDKMTQQAGEVVNNGNEVLEALEVAGLQDSVMHDEEVAPVDLVVHDQTPNDLVDLNREVVEEVVERSIVAECEPDIDMGEPESSDDEFADCISFTDTEEEDDTSEVEDNKGVVIDPVTGYIIDPDSGDIIDPKTGRVVDPLRDLFEELGMKMPKFSDNDLIDILDAADDEGKDKKKSAKKIAAPPKKKTPTEERIEALIAEAKKPKPKKTKKTSRDIKITRSIIAPVKPRTVAQTNGKMPKASLTNGTVQKQSNGVSTMGNGVSNGTSDNGTKIQNGHSSTKVAKPVNGEMKKVNGTQNCSKNVFNGSAVTQANKNNAVSTNGIGKCSANAKANGHTGVEKQRNIKNGLCPELKRDSSQKEKVTKPKHNDIEKQKKENISKEGSDKMSTKNDIHKEKVTNGAQVNKISSGISQTKEQSSINTKHKIKDSSIDLQEKAVAVTEPRVSKTNLENNAITKLASNDENLKIRGKEAESVKPLKSVPALEAPPSKKQLPHQKDPITTALEPQDNATKQIKTHGSEPTITHEPKSKPSLAELLDMTMNSKDSTAINLNLKILPPPPSRPPPNLKPASKSNLPPMPKRERVPPPPSMEKPPPPPIDQKLLDSCIDQSRRERNTNF